MPTEVSSRVGFFDRFAGLTARDREPGAVLRLLHPAGARSGCAGRGRDRRQGHFSAFLSSTYQLEINTTTTIITFLLVALLQNSQTRSDRRRSTSSTRIADGLADLMSHLAERR